MNSTIFKLQSGTR